MCCGSDVNQTDNSAKQVAQVDRINRRFDRPLSSDERCANAGCGKNEEQNSGPNVLFVQRYGANCCEKKSYQNQQASLPGLDRLNSEAAGLV